MNKIIFFMSIMIAHALAASSAAPIAYERDQKRLVDVTVQKENPATQGIASQVRDVILTMPKELCALVAIYARLAPLVIANDLPQEWAHVPSDSDMTIRYGSVCKRLVPGQQIDLTAEHDFSRSMTPDGEYVEITITYPGIQGSIKNESEDKMLDMQALTEGRTYRLGLHGDRFPLLVRTDANLSKD